MHGVMREYCDFMQLYGVYYVSELQVLIETLIHK